MITLVPTRYYFTARIYDAAGNVQCPWCGSFYREAGGHYCRDLAWAIPSSDGGFVAPSTRREGRR